MLELGADSFWYYGIGAFIFAGNETVKSVSGKEYIISDYIIKSDDIITIDLSPQIKKYLGRLCKNSNYTKRQGCR